MTEPIYYTENESPTYTEDEDYVTDFVHPAEIRRRREDFARSQRDHHARAHGAINTFPR